MRAVMPRILRNGEGQPVKEAASAEAPLFISRGRKTELNSRVILRYHP